MNYSWDRTVYTLHQVAGVCVCVCVKLKIKTTTPWLCSFSPLVASRGQNSEMRENEFKSLMTFFVLRDIWQHQAVTKYTANTLCQSLLTDIKL